MAGVQQVSFTNPYQADEMAVLRRQKMAEALQQQSMQPLETNRMAGRVAIPIHPLEGLAKMAQGASGAYMSSQADERRREMIRQMQGDAAKWYGNAPQGTPAQIQDTSQEGTGSFDMSGTTGPANVPAQAPSRQAQMQHLMSGMQNPMSAPIAQMQLAQLVKQDEPRVVGKSLMTGAGKVIGTDPAYLQEQAAARDARMKELEMRLADQRLAREDRAALSRELAEMQIAARKDLAGIAASLRQPQAPTMTEIIDPSDPSRMLRVDAKAYKGGSVGAPGVLGVSGKEPVTAKRAEKEDQGKELLKTELDNLREHYRTLNDARAIPSTERGTGSNVASWLQGSGPGQVLGRMGGTREQKARDEIQSARLRVLNAIKNATGMSAQQLNSNVELKTWLDSMTSMQGSYEANVGIIDAIEKAFLKNKKATTTPTPEGGQPRIVDW